MPLLAEKGLSCSLKTAMDWQGEWAMRATKHGVLANLGMARKLGLGFALVLLLTLAVAVARALPVSPVLVAELWAVTAPESPEVAEGLEVRVAAPPAAPLA